RNELQEVAAIQWQFNDALVFDDGPNRGVFCGQQRAAPGYLNRLGYLANLHRDVDTSRLLDLKLDTCLIMSLETGHFDFQSINTRLHRGEAVHAGVIA